MSMVTKIWLCVLCVLAYPFLVFGGIGVLLYSAAYPFAFPYMLLKWNRILTWDEYWRWDWEG